MEILEAEDITVIDDSCAREEWGWTPMYTDLEKLVADFVQEVKTRPEYYGLR